MYVNEAPGFGVDINEELAAKIPAARAPRLLGTRPKTRRHRRQAVTVRSRRLRNSETMLILREGYHVLRITKTSVLASPALVLCANL
jgi:hypothetical protein